MLLDLSKPFEAKKAETKLSQLIEKGAKIELTEKKAMRSVKQNSYLHAILTIFAVEYGETIEYTKQNIFKATVNADLFIYERTNKITGEIREALLSSKDISKDEMIIAIEKFRKFASDNGIYLMDADEFKQNYFLVQQMEEQNKIYL
jgi:predicted lipase